jgi:hypothetical protein
MKKREVQISYSTYLVLGDGFLHRLCRWQPRNLLPGDDLAVHSELTQAVHLHHDGVVVLRDLEAFGLVIAALLELGLEEKVI